MTSDLGFTCTCCGAHHPELPMNHTASAPAVWEPAFAGAEDCMLSSRENFSRAADLWDSPGSEAENPYFGRLTTDLAAYPVTTLNLKTHLHTRRVGERPFIELEPTDHPLAVEQRTGITLGRVREFAAAVLHSSPSERQ